MADISDDEIIEKPKRVMSDRQKEALKKGRELAKANREAQKPKVEEAAEEPKPEKKTRKKKELAVEIPEVKNEVVPQGKRISRKKAERSPSPQRTPSPEPVKKTRTPRAKKVEQAAPPVQQVRQKPSLQFV